MIPGVDVYQGYGPIDWNLVAASGVRFAWIKCREANDYKDENYERNVQRARATGIHVGAYHVAHPLPKDVPGRPFKTGRTPLEQAELFFKGCAGLGSDPGELSPALDLEWPAPEDWQKWGCSAQQISDWARECCEAMALLWGRLPIIYVYPHWWRTLAHGADVSWAARYPLWLADYGWRDEGSPPDDWNAPHLSWVSSAWERWDACQHSAQGSSVRVPGIPACPVDRDVIRDEETLRRLTGQSAWDPDADTQPRLVPIVRPPVPHHHPMTGKLLDHPSIDEDDDPPPEAA